MESLTSQRHQMRVALNLVLTFFTCGLWLPIWGIIEIVRYANRRQP